MYGSRKLSKTCINLVIPVKVENNCSATVWLPTASFTFLCVKCLGCFKNSGEEPSVHTLHLFRQSYFLLWKNRPLSWEISLAEHLDPEAFCHSANAAKLFCHCSLLQFSNWFCSKLAFRKLTENKRTILKACFTFSVFL